MQYVLLFLFCVKLVLRHKTEPFELTSIHSVLDSKEKNDLVSCVFQMLWERDVSITAWFTVMAKVSSPIVSTAVCVWMGRLDVCHSAPSTSHPGSGVSRPSEWKSQANVVRNGSAKSPVNHARPTPDTPLRRVSSVLLFCVVVIEMSIRIL